MIPITPAPEPPAFDTKVRRRGHYILRSNPNPSNELWKKASYWKECLPDLRKAYKNICAYSACWMPGSTTVDHYLSKKARPELAYEWSNYRLAWVKMNCNKGESTDIADPFTICSGWFVLNFSNFFVEPGDNLPADILRLVARTIEILKLNDDDLIDFRFHAVQVYARGETTLAFLESHYPFVHYELLRQGFAETIKDRFN